MPNSVTARLRARDGDEHLVAVERAIEARWRVIDIAPALTVLVDTLADPEDHAPRPRRSRATTPPSRTRTTAACGDGDRSRGTRPWTA